MKSPTGRLLFLALLLPVSVETYSQALSVVYVDPVMESTYAVAATTIISEQQQQVKRQVEIAAPVTAITVETTLMKKWEDAYNGYLQTASGFATAIKAGSHIYTSAVRTFLNISQLMESVQENPEGLAASALLSDIYIDTASELVSVFTLLRSAVAKGGEENMLTGEERLELLWSLNDKIESLNDHIRALSLSIRYYNLTDVWNQALAGIVDHTNGEIAEIAMERWRRRITAR